MTLLNVADYERVAQEKMEKMFFDYYASGAMDEHTLRDNQEAYGRIKLLYRVLRGLKTRDLSTTILGHPIDLPIIIAPSGFQKLAHPDGELAMARAASTAGTIMTLSTAATSSLEEVAEVAERPLWFQLYMYKDKGLTKSLVQRAKEAGYSAIAFTVDLPVLGRRERDMRNQFALPAGLTLKNFTGEKDDFPQTGGSGLNAYTQELFKFDLSYEDLDWLCANSDLPVWVKGIAHPDDALMSLEHGASGIWVSNHGGRQLDTAPATIDTLPDIAEAINGKAPIILDGGIRRGGDVFKALALGADVVAIGRAALWGLATNGQAGVEAVLGILADELDNIMALCGVNTINDISETYIW